MICLCSLCRSFSNNQTKRILYLVGAVAWSLWLIRNEFVFQNLVIPSPKVGIFRSISFFFFLQKWKLLNKETDRRWIEMVIQKLNRQLIIKAWGLTRWSWSLVPY
jgi:hypothetical protein